MSSEVDTTHDGGVAEPVPDPGLPPHQERLTDVDAAHERRVERQVAAFFLTAALLALGFFIAYFAIDKNETFLGWSAQNFALGSTLGFSLLLIGVGIIQWARKLMGDHEMVEERHLAISTDDERAHALAELNDGLDESGIQRRPLIRNTLFIALGSLALPGVAILRDLGPLPHGQDKTVWKKGVRVVNDVSGEPIKPSDIQVGQLINAEPSVLFDVDDHGHKVIGAHEALAVKAKAAVIVVRIRPEDITPAKGRENWGVDGILVYSKICTHVGCPISLWEQQTHHLLCPCHQSTFDLADNGKVIFGPAYRPLPQLPIAVDDEGYLIAVSDFPEIVAPSYPELARDQKKLDEKA